MERVTQRQFWGDTWSDVFEREFHEGPELHAPLSFAVSMEISKGCVMVMTSVWLHDRSSCNLWKSP